MSAWEVSFRLTFASNSSAGLVHTNGWQRSFHPSWQEALGLPPLTHREMLASDLAGPLNIGNPDERSVLQIARDVIDGTGARSAIAFIERPVDDPAVRRPDITCARERLGWEPAVPWPEGLARTIGRFEAGEIAQRRCRGAIPANYAIQAVSLLKV